MIKRRNYRPSANEANRPNPRPNYRRIIEAVLQDGTLSPTPGAVSVINVQHDDWCAIFQGEPCDCDPDIIQDPPLPADMGKTPIKPENG
jgi:hypothetical protein